MNTHDRPSSVPWPPILYIIAISAGFILQAYFPLPWFGRFVADALFGVGIVLVIGSIALIGLSAWTLVQHKTTFIPTKKADHLVTSGPFSFSRNPIYVGDTALTLGLGIIFSNPWLFIMAVAAAIFVNYLQIVPEEKHLHQQFGKSWRNYTKKARRWI